MRAHARYGLYKLFHILIYISVIIGNTKKHGEG